MSAIGLIYGNCFEDIDHLAPLIDILHLSLFVTEEEIRTKINRFYPSVNVRLVLPNDLGKILLKEGNTLISCMPTAKIRRLFGLEEMMQKKQLHTLFLPHGYSKQDLTRSILSEKNVLVLGKKMIDIFYSLNQTLNFRTLVSVGNYRYLYYLKQKESMGKNLESPFTHTTHHPAVFFPYDHESPEHIHYLREHLEKDWQLFVKYHAKKLNDPINLELLNEEKLDTPYVYPYLERGALFVIEESSVVYDALFFDTPTFFFKDHPELDTLGIKFNPNMAEGFKKVERLRAKKKEVLPYVFDLYDSLDQIEQKVTPLLKDLAEQDNETY